MSALSRALDHWQAGRSIPLTLAQELVEEGYDPGQLQRFHRKISPTWHTLTRSPSPSSTPAV